MRYCSVCHQRIPAHEVAVLVDAIEQGSGPGIGVYRHEGCARSTAPAQADQPAPPVGIRRAP